MNTAYLWAWLAHMLSSHACQSLFIVVLPTNTKNSFCGITYGLSRYHAKHMIVGSCSLVQYVGEDLLLCIFGETVSCAC